MRLRRNLLLATLATVAAVTTFGACTSSATSAASSTAPTTATTKKTVAPTATNNTAPRVCHPAPGYKPGTTTHHIIVAGADRALLVHMPPHPTASMRLIVDFHGAGSNMYEQDVYSGFDPVADKNGFVVASPNGIDGPIRQWRFLGTQDDVNFATAVVRTLSRSACVDGAHAYAVGISSGSAMSASLACQASEAFAGFGLVAGNFYLPPLCDKAERRPILIFHGTADPVVPYKGGHIGGPSGTPVQPEETTAALWAGHNGCQPGMTATKLSSQVVRLTWNGCAVPVVMYKIVGGGHTWPGAAIDVTRLGLTTKQVSATAEMWKLFSR